MDEKEKEKFFIELLELLNKYDLTPMHNTQGYVLGRITDYSYRQIAFTFPLVRELVVWLDENRSEFSYKSVLTIKSSIKLKLERAGRNVR